MGIILNFSKEKLILGIMYTREENLKKTLKILKNKFGKIDYISEEHQFDWTSYYNEEMGNSVKKILISFEKLVKVESLSKIKIWTNKIEKKISENNCRKINLDPGIMDLHRLILATTKNRGHRFPLQKGIYGEVTIIYQSKRYQELPWTYDDYKSDALKNDLISIRNILKNQYKIQNK